MGIDVIAAGLGGLLFGSFANVVVHRVPRRESLVRPGSRCPACGSPIRARDNIPVVSWLVLRGRCRRCAARISWRYPAVEAATAILFALAVLRIPSSAHSRWDLLAYLPLLWVLVPLSAIDFESKILPNRIVVPAIGAEAALLAAAAAAGPGLRAWVGAAAGGVISFLAFFAIALVSPRGMGMGDVKMSGLLGLGLGYLGWRRAVLGFFLASLVGAVVGIGLMVAGRAGRKTQLPFGPWLALGAVLSILYGDVLVRAWLGR